MAYNLIVYPAFKTKSYHCIKTSSNNEVHLWFIFCNV